ncbi:MAG: dTMP kinase [Myxococcota bacterium]
MPLLIALEGIDGAGTTTQTRLLAAWMGHRGLAVHATREPSDGPVGLLLRQILRGAIGSDARAVALLFAADRINHVEREIGPALAAGRHVVTDRYVLSSLAYQSLDCDEVWIETINRFARPADITLLLDVPVDAAAERRAREGRAQERFDAGDVQRRVADRYRGLARARGATVLDGTLEPERVHEDVVAHVAPLL